MAGAPQNQRGGSTPRRHSKPLSFMVDIGSVVAGYKLIRRIGQGVHGTVYLAEDVGRLQSLTQPVALKLMPLPAGEDVAKHHKAFMRNATASAALIHPGIVTLYRAGVEGGLGWLAMEPVPGSDLSRYTQPHRLLPEPVVLQVGDSLAQALGYAHGQGVVHRDLKPANVLVDWPSRTVKLADFGLARLPDAAQTDTGVVLGTPAYMAPEQIAGGLPTPQTDFYSLGVLLFQLLTGRLPHLGASMGELLMQVARQPAPDLRDLRPGVPAPLAELVAKLLFKRAADRWAHAPTIAQALRDIGAAWPDPAA
jgi:eukaryotic-like serine/threonine-protein kinase